jgi:membrane-associated phospholipid phosphatase
VKHFFAEGKWFLTPCFVLAILVAALLLYLPKGDEIVFIHTQQTHALNVFFRVVTSLSEWPITIIILIFSIIHGLNKGVLLTLTTLLNAVLVTTLKKGVFAGYVRPALFFEGKLALNFVPGVEIYKYNSFPSGHTAAAFALFFMMSLLVKDKRLSLVFFLVATLVGFSRVYLLQHFLIDVYFGAILGAVVAVFCWQISKRFSYFGTSSLAQNT